MTYPLEPPIVAIVGATGTGKSALAIALARHLGGECVNADSMQFYRGMNIGTAKITAEEMQGFLTICSIFWISRRKPR